MWKRWRDNDTHPCRITLHWHLGLLYHLSGCLVQLSQPAHQIRREENEMKKNNLLLMIERHWVWFTLGYSLGIFLGLQVGKSRGHQ
jgi:hypothetical protein